MDELTDDNLVVINKNAQTAIPRDEIERIAKATPRLSITRMEESASHSGIERIPSGCEYPASIRA